MLAWTLSQLRSSFIGGEICRCRRGNVNLASVCRVKVIPSALLTPSALIGGKRSDTRLCRILLAPSTRKRMVGPNERNKSASPHFNASVLCPDGGTSRFTHFGSSFTILVSSPLNPRYGYLQVGADSPRREQLEPGEPVLRLVRCWSERDRGERGEERRPGSKRWGGPQ